LFEKFISIITKKTVVSGERFRAIMSFLYELDFMHSGVKAMAKEALSIDFYFIHAQKYKKRH
jgi:hypothetical protein